MRYEVKMNNNYLNSFKSDNTKKHFNEFLQEWKKVDTMNLFNN